MSASTVPAVLSALAGLVATALPGVQVFSGPPLQNLAADFVAVGWHDQVPAVSLAGDQGDLALARDAESYDIVSQAVSWRGDAGSYLVSVSRVYTLVDAVQSALALAPTLSLTGRSAGAVVTFAGSDLAPAQTERGPVAVLNFSVHVEAWRS